MIRFLILCLAAFVCACAPKMSTVPDQAENRLEGIWQHMQAYDNYSEKPYRAQLSLRFGTEGDTRRVTAILWGNNDNRLRLDVMAGVGAIIAKVMEDGEHFLIFTPRENKAYFHDGPNSPLLKIGVPLPFTLAQLADLLNARYGAVFGQKYRDATLVDNDSARFNLEEGPQGELVVDSQGLPQSWEQPRGWKMAITYDDASRPHSLKLANPAGKKAILLVKEWENPAQPFTAEQMALQVPDGVPLLPLSKYKPS